MAIDIKSISQLIAEFRKQTAKDSITPESLGYILQRLADLLATAGTSDTVDKLQKLLDGFRSAGYALTSITQGQTDRNHVYANIGKVSLVDGSTSSTSGIFIQQATTERAGAMRAQQVTDLNAARKNVTELQKAVADANNIIDTICVKLGLDGGKGVITNAQISCTVINGYLHVLGAANLISNGYVPYLFRNVRKRNPFDDKDASPEELAQKDYGPATKGWGVFGSIYTTKVNGTRVEISKNGHSHMCVKAVVGYSPNPDYFVSHYVSESGEPRVGYGRSSISLLDRGDKKGKQHRMIRLRFAIGFAKPIYPGRAKITPANLASNLAEFSLIYNTATRTWHFGKCTP